MRVLYVNAVNAIGSTGRTYAQLAYYLKKNVHEGYIAYSRGPRPEIGYKIGNVIDKKLHAFLSRITGKQAYFSHKSTKQLLRYIEAIKPDVIHLGNLHENFININILLNYISIQNIPVVITLHDCWFFTGKCTHYTVDNCYKWKTTCGECPRLKKDNKSWFFDRTAEMLRDKKELIRKIPKLAVAGPSRWILNEAKTSLLSSANRLRMIRNWVDMELFKPVPAVKIKKEIGIHGKFVILGVSSKWSGNKGLRKFLKLSQFIDNDMVIVLVGENKKSKGLPSNIVSVGATDNVHQLSEYYSMADVFINFSLEETFGKVTAEALSCGTPAVVLNSTANPELIDTGCGYVCDPERFDEIIEAIFAVKEQGKEKYRENCLFFAKQEFSFEKNARKYLSLYKDIINA